MDSRHESLTPRERQICDLAAQGLSQKDVAAHLGISAGYVKVHFSRHIYRKLGVTSQAELIRYWIVNVEMAHMGDCTRCLLRAAVLEGAK